MDPEHDEDGEDVEDDEDDDEDDEDDDTWLASQDAQEMMRVTDWLSNG